MKRNEAFPSKYLKAEDLDGEDLTVTISHATHEEFKDRDGKPDNKPILHFVDEKPLVLNLTNWKAIEKVHGSDDTEDWKGKQITLYSTEVDAFGETKLAIRVRLTAPKAKAAAATVQPVTDMSDDGADRFWKQAKALGVNQDDAKALAKRVINGETTWDKAIQALDLPF